MLLLHPVASKAFALDLAIWWHQLLMGVSTFLGTAACSTLGACLHACLHGYVDHDDDVCS